MDSFPKLEEEELMGDSFCQCVKTVTSTEKDLVCWYDHDGSQGSQCISPWLAGSIPSSQEGEYRDDVVCFPSEDIVSELCKDLKQQWRKCKAWLSKQRAQQSPCLLRIPFQNSFPTSSSCSREKRNTPYKSEQKILHGFRNNKVCI